LCLPMTRIAWQPELTSPPLFATSLHFIFPELSTRKSYAGNARGNWNWFFPPRSVGRPLLVCRRCQNDIMTSRFGN
jgi:hypothetical protein